MAQADFKIEGGVLLAYEGKDAIVTVPDGVSVIGSNAFYGNGTVTCVYLPDSVAEIAFSAFQDCHALAEIKLPRRPIKVAESAFRRTPFCPESNEGGWGYENPVYVDGHLVVVPRVILDEFIVKEGTEFIDNRVFWEKKLPAVRLPEGLREIGDGAFEVCRALTEVTLPDSMVKIGKDAFKNCTSLKKITLPSSLAEMGAGAFAGCRILRDVKLPEGVAVGENAFLGAGAPLGVCLFDESINVPFDEIPTEKKTYRLFTVEGEDMMDGVLLGLDRFTATPCDKEMWDVLMDACNEWEIKYEHVDDFDPGDECGYAEPDRTVLNERYSVYPENCLVRDGKVIGFTAKGQRLLLNTLTHFTINFPKDDDRYTEYETYSLERRKV